MLPGMMCDARLFAPQIDALQADYEIIVPQLCYPDSIAAIAERVLREVQPPRFNLLGLSMGGIVAMSMVGLAPQRVSRLALLDTNHLADPPERRPLRNRQIADVKQGKLRAVIVGEMKPNYLAGGSRGNSHLLDTLITMAMDLGADCFIAQSIALRDRPDQSDPLRCYPGPTLVLCGEEDALCPVSRHEAMVELCQRGRLAIIPSAGHITPLEQPQRVNAEIARWLNE